MNEIFDEYGFIREDVWEQFRLLMEEVAENLSQQTGLQIEWLNFEEGSNDVTLSITLPEPFNETTITRTLAFSNMLDVDSYDEAIFNAINRESVTTLTESIGEYCGIELALTFDDKCF